ncbi:YegP family protein [Nocardioides sp. KIGAM211]|uniref:YegP family protein n=1 Tax=Nocardioides luti TaxID=2761101 RepID=A0A7X0RFT9_9ACTN|nr:YegP family protein [Nocardioides luti]
MTAGLVAVFEVSRFAGTHRWILRNWDGEILAQNGGYLTRGAAVQDIERLRVATVTANVVEV